MVEPRKEIILGSSASRPGSAGIYDRANPAIPTLDSRTPDRPGGEDISGADFVNVEARKEMPHSRKSDNSKAGARQRRSWSAGPNPSQWPSPHNAQQTPSPSYPNPSSGSSSSAFQNAHNQPLPAFHPPSLHFPPAASPYSQRSGFGGQYTISPQPNPLNMSHPPPSYAYPPTYHPSMVPENSMVSPNMHPGYPPMMQAHTSVFSYQRHPAEGGASSHPSFPNTPSPSVYTSHPTHPSSTPTTPHQPPSSGQTSSMSAQYISTPNFQYMPAYGYPTQPYPSSPIYQPQYSPVAYGQHYTPPTEAEPQIAWYYYPQLASGPSAQPYDPGSTYHTHYTMGYPQSGHSGMDNSYNSGAHASGSNQGGSSAEQLAPSSTSFISRYRDDDQRSVNSPPPTGIGPSMQSQGTEGAQTAAHSASTGSGRQAASERPLVRRSFHPDPPAHRSEWVMWVGNVPSDATHDELWRFFIAPADQQQEHLTNGVISVFLISRSNCAFINYQSMEDLQQAITRFNGVPLRLNDARCPRLVCRVRRKDDDLKAGVGYQRGMGMHTRWIREQKVQGEAQKETVETAEGASSPVSPTASIARAMSSVSLSSDDDGKKSLQPAHSGSSESYSSTNSSFLARYFPKRYFILKSLSQEDLDTSVERGVWATQKHNEEILDQAFRTSKEVYLIFGVNKSREFYGYARMAGPVLRGQQSVQWATRPQQRPATGTRASLPVMSDGQPGTFLSPSDQRLVDSSPLSMGGSTSSPQAPGKPNALRQTAPPVLGGQYHKPTLETPAAKHASLDPPRTYFDRGRSGRFALDASAPARAIRGNQSQGGPAVGSDAMPSSLDRVHEHEEHEHEEDAARGPETEEEAYDLTTPVIQPDEDVQRGEVSWGDSFAVEWLCTDRLSFNNTRHLRNPWNRDKEIKVSRDGTELEPSVGQQLLEDWHKAPETHSTPAGTPARPGASGKRAAASKPGYPFPIVDGELEGHGGEEGSRVGPSRT